MFQVGGEKQLNVPDQQIVKAENSEMTQGINEGSIRDVQCHHFGGTIFLAGGLL